MLNKTIACLVHYVCILFERDIFGILITSVIPKRSRFLLPAPGGTIITWFELLLSLLLITIITWFAEDWPGLVLLSVLELSLTFWALSLMLFLLLLLLALLTRRSMMLKIDSIRAMMLKVLMSLLPVQLKIFEDFQDMRSIFCELWIECFKMFYFKKNK